MKEDGDGGRRARTGETESREETGEIYFYGERKCEGKQVEERMAACPSAERSAGVAPVAVTEQNAATEELSTQPG
ncbi:hypothetical protein EYF80_054619 [Liparis tanakae]|uniref:Uncharacterized protein n=1 Tax=Liparis tanakae TaxID=230148 RepID=A0A4Z2F3F9_9TELE|nr:hypothetical protein EYF80_054619 [Liparis tanakae]